MTPSQRIDRFFAKHGSGDTRLDGWHVVTLGLSGVDVHGCILAIAPTHYLFADGTVRPRCQNDFLLPPDVHPAELDDAAASARRGMRPAWKLALEAFVAARDASDALRREDFGTPEYRRVQRRHAAAQEAVTAAGAALFCFPVLRATDATELLNRMEREAA